MWLRDACVLRPEVPHFLQLYYTMREVLNLLPKGRVLHHIPVV
jgi:hypothetical protein